MKVIPRGKLTGPAQKRVSQKSKDGDMQTEKERASDRIGFEQVSTFLDMSSKMSIKCDSSRDDVLAPSLLIITLILLHKYS